MATTRTQSPDVFQSFPWNGVCVCATQWRILSECSRHTDWQVTERNIKTDRQTDNVSTYSRTPNCDHIPFFTLLTLYVYTIIEHVCAWVWVRTIRTLFQHMCALRSTVSTNRTMWIDSLSHLILISLKCRQWEYIYARVRRCCTMYAPVSPSAPPATVVYLIMVTHNVKCIALSAASCHVWAWAGTYSLWARARLSVSASRSPAPGRTKR